MGSEVSGILVEESLISTFHLNDVPESSMIYWKWVIIQAAFSMENKKVRSTITPKFNIITNY